MNYISPIFKKNWGLFLILLYEIIIASISIEDGHNWGGDFALYLEQGVSIFSGEFFDFYEKNLFTINNSHSTLAPIAEPILTPILLGFLNLFTGLNFISFKLLMVFFLLASTIVFWKTLEHISIKNVTFKTLCVFFVFSYFEFYFLLETINSDMPFLFFSIISIYFFVKFLKNNEIKFATYSLVLATVSYFTRDAGLTIILAIVISIIAKHKSNLNLTLLLSCLMPFVIILIFKSTLPSFNYNLLNLVRNEISFTRLINSKTALVNSITNNINPLNRWYDFIIIQIFIYFTIVYGYCKFFQKAKFINLVFTLLILIYSTFYIIAGGTEERYFLLLNLFLPIYFLYGLQQILSILLKDGRIKTLILIIFVAQGSAKDYFKIREWCIKENSLFRDRILNENANKIWETIKNLENKNTIVFFRKPTVLRLMTGKNSCVYLEDSIFNNRADYDFYILYSSSIKLSPIKNNLKSISIQRDTVKQIGEFTLVKIFPIEKSN
jgi:hypothetical protein